MKNHQTLGFHYTGSISKLLMVVLIFSANILSAQTVVEKIVQEENKDNRK